MATFYKKHLRLSCRQASQLLTRQAEARLTLTEQLRLWWHLRLCDPCARFSRQVRLLDQLLTRNTPNGRIRQAPTLRPERRAEMAERIKNQLTQ